MADSLDLQELKSEGAVFSNSVIVVKKIKA